MNNSGFHQVNFRSGSRSPQARAVKETATDERLDTAIVDATAWLKGLQSDDGYWLFDLEADVTIPSEYILLQHFLDEVDPEVEAKLAAYIRECQADHGGWPLFYDGDFDMSCSVKAYYALKLAGDAPDEPHMKLARDSILSRGGAARCNVFTRLTLAMFGQVPWRATPVMPVEIMLLPRWFPFHLSKVSYWSRTVIVPLLARWRAPSCSSTVRCASPSRCSPRRRASRRSQRPNPLSMSASTAKTDWAASSRPWPTR